MCARKNINIQTSDNLRSRSPCSDDGAIKPLDAISLGQLIEWDRLRMGQCFKKMVQWYHQGVILLLLGTIHKQAGGTWGNFLNLSHSLLNLILAGLIT